MEKTKTMDYYYKEVEGLTDEELYKKLLKAADDFEKNAWRWSRFKFLWFKPRYYYLGDRISRVVMEWYYASYMHSLQSMV